jgi:S-adenosylmethionine:tRNA ribosyltransferase-isomerase
MRVSEFDYQLPPQLIAQQPLAERDASRMLLLDRRTGSVRDENFAALADVLRRGDLLVFNNARVIPARLFGRRVGIHAQPPSHASAREHLTGTVEVFLTRQTEPDTWEALVRPGRKLPVGERVIFGQGQLEAEIIARGELGLRTVRFVSRDDKAPADHIERLGHVPLPPYIEREDEILDRERYQTVFAKKPRAVAAPTAGLHFTQHMMERLRREGIQTCEITLDVGLGTFQPIHSETLEEHKIHSEAYEIPQDTAEAIREARSAGRPVMAVGTTAVRALEDAAQRAVLKNSQEPVLAGSSEARIFIRPGHEFRIVDGMLTNFHLPRSTLLALVCAFAGREKVLAAYQYAVAAHYRFYSYGDCMLIR